MKGLNYKLISISASLALIIIALSIAYYLVIFLPSKEKFKQEELGKAQESEQQEQLSEKQKYRYCQNEATKSAQEALEKKAKLATGQLKSILEKAVEEGMYYKDDYNYSYQQCLERQGLE